MNKNICILKLFNFYIIKKSELNKFNKTYKNNFILFFHFFLPSNLHLYFLHQIFLKPNIL